MPRTAGTFQPTAARFQVREGMLSSPCPAISHSSPCATPTPDWSADNRLLYVDFFKGQRFQMYKAELEEKMAYNRQHFADDDTRLKTLDNPLHDHHFVFLYADECPADSGGGNRKTGSISLL